MRLKRFLLICVLVACTLLSLFAVACKDTFETKLANAETNSVSDFYDLDTTPTLVVLDEEDFGIRFKLKRRYVSSNSVDGDFSPLYLKTDYDYSIFRFTISTEGKDLASYIVECNKTVIASYKDNGSYEGYDIDFDSFEYGRVSGSYFQAYKNARSGCTLVGVVENTNGVFFPFLNNECNITISGDSIEHTVGYQLKVEYGIVTDVTLRKEYDSWWDELWKTDNYNLVIDSCSEYRGELKKPSTSTMDSEFGVSIKSLCQEILADTTTAVKTFGSVDSVNYQYAEKLASNSVTKSITVRWLEDLPLTPFAKLCEAIINVEVDDMGVTIADVEAALLAQHNIEFDRVACKSIIKRFDLTGEDNYTALYESKIVVTVKTKDGNSEYYTLDCNKSLEAFYASSDENNLRANEILGVDFSGPMINEIVTNLYPVLSSTYDIEYASQLYGLWGFVVIPETTSFSFNMLMSSDSETDKQYVLKSYDLKGQITKEQYEKLLKAYGYSDFAIDGNKIAQYFDTNTKNCTCILFFCDGESDTAGIVQPGQSFDSADDDPVWLDKFQDGWNGVVNWVKDLFNKDGNAADSFLRALKIIASVALLIFGFVFLGSLVNKKR